MRPSKTSIDYVRHFKLQQNPFSPGLWSDLPFLGPSQKKWLDAVLLRVSRGDGLTLLKGIKGSGRSTLLFSAYQALPHSKDAIILSGHRDVSKLLATIVTELNLDPKSADSPLGLFIHHLQSVRTDLRSLVIFVDDVDAFVQNDAQNFSKLLALPTIEKLPLQFVLAGSSESFATLESYFAPEILNASLPGVSIVAFQQTETHGYINFRLKHAGAERPLFSLDALERIHSYSEGIPLRINRLADQCLQHASIAAASQVSASMVDRVMRSSPPVNKRQKQDQTAPNLYAPTGLVLGLIGLAFILYQTNGLSRFMAERTVTVEGQITKGPKESPPVSVPEEESQQLNTKQNYKKSVEESIAPPAVFPLSENNVEQIPDESIQSVSIDPEVRKTHTVTESQTSDPKSPIPKTMAPVTSITAWLDAHPTLTPSQIEMELFRLWLPEMPSSAKVTCSNAMLVGLRCERFRGDFEHLMQLDLPAVVPIKLSNGIQQQVVMSHLSPPLITLMHHGEGRVFSLDEFLNGWTGEAMLLWHPSSEVPFNERQIVQAEPDATELQWLVPYLHSGTAGVHSSGLLDLPENKFESPHLSAPDSSSESHSCGEKDTF